jgi:PAS domain S-box-containing protein
MADTRRQPLPGFLDVPDDDVDAAVITTDEQFVVTAWNAAAERLYGWSTDEVVGRRVHEVFRPMMDEATRLDVRRRTSQGGRSRVEVVSQRKDGTPVEVEIINGAVRGAGDAITGYLEIHRDLSRPREPAARGQDAQQRVDEVLERISDAFYAVDREWRFTYLNERAVRGLSYLAGRPFAADELLGRTLWETLPAIVGTSTEARYRRAMREQRAAVFEATHPGDGPTLLIHAHPSERGLSVYSRDITARRSAEEDRGSPARQQALVAELGIGALGSDDLESVMDDAAAVVAHTLGVPITAIAQHLPGGEQLLLRAGFGWEEGAVGTVTGAAGHRSLVGHTLAAGAPLVSEDVTTDERFEISDALAALDPVSGVSAVIAGRDRPFGVLAAFSQQRRWFSETDVHFMQAVANVLATAVERSETAERLIEVRELERSRIARDLHDEALQDLSRAVAQAAGLGSAEGAQEASDQLARLLPALQRVGEQLRGAIYDLRLDGEQHRPFAELLQALVEVHRGMAPDLRIDVRLEDGLPSGSLGALGTEILRIVGEALTNARRHAGADHVRVHVGGSRARLHVEVSDDGRGHDASLPVSRGSGIKGMRERAELLDAQLDLVSRPGGGSLVRVEVLLDTDGPKRGERTRVLLVEDHSTVREAIASAFERDAGFDVVGQAATHAEARDLLDDVEVAVVDLGLPDGYGGDLIRELGEVNPRAQALVLSATLDRADVARAVESGAAGVLHKTAHIDEVVRAVRRLRAGETLMDVEDVIELLRYAGRERERDYADQRAVAELTAREREVLQLLAEGLDTEQIARRLFITVRTERNHMAHIISKLGVHSQLQALVFALRTGVVHVKD